ncbi:MAG TPA: cation-translocating P-type ATPase [Candidatus Aminicenantes bacterium]|nr:cation-translocating P-type ATPase [Candidatus Aminicenantes bacterium]
MADEEPTTRQDAASAYRLTCTEVAMAWASDSGRGLDPEEARARMTLHGRNELLEEKRVPPWRRFLAQFEDVLIVLLLVATAISTLLWIMEHETALPYEALAILAVVLLNATMGFFQETRAEAALAAMRAMTAGEATVVRGGERQRIPATELVPGDLVRIEEGDAIPADARLVESVALQTAEASLTGESLPVSKFTEAIATEAALGDQGNMVFAGTVATYGHGSALVVATGMQTEMGRIAGMLRQTPSDPTPLQRALNRTGKLFGWVVAVIAVIMIATILLVEDVRGLTQVFDVLILGVALAVAAVPEGLPAVVTAVLSIGVQRMARRQAIVRHLAAVETLGSASVIASDKTGTLTQNEMTVRRVVTAGGRAVFTGEGYSPVGTVRPEGGEPFIESFRNELEQALTAVDLANNSQLVEKNGHWTVFGDPTEGALHVAARKFGLTAEVLDDRLPRTGEIPFSSERKLMSTLHRVGEDGKDRLVFTKGAPDVLLAKCARELSGTESTPLTRERRAEILRINDELAHQAMRTLGVAFRSMTAELPNDPRELETIVEQQLVFIGLIAMIDPPRAEARTAVAKAVAAGIRPLLITGDHPQTALVIARELGIASNDRVIVGTELEHMEIDDLVDTVREVSVYARVNPGHKLRIVEALQRGGGVVAMTGDGVNDAPALKRADIGIAMGITGTEVAKGAADIVLADDNFATIVAAIEEGRIIFSNIRKFLRYLLSSNIGEVLTMFFGVLLARRLGLHEMVPNGAITLPLLATQVLWINLVTDGAPALALGLNPAARGMMAKPPRPARESVITGRMWGGIVVSGLVMAAGTLFTLDAAMPGGFIAGTGDLPRGQTVAFTTLVLFQMFNVLNSRSDERSAFIGLFTNRWLWGGIALSVALQIVVVTLPSLQKAFGTVPLTASEWLRCALVASSVLWLRELNKSLLRRRRAPRQRNAS